MKIKSLGIAHFCEDGTTVEVFAESFGSKQKFYVQTTDGEYRNDLGCWILTPESGGCIDYDDYSSYDIDAIIKVAEAYIEEQQQPKETNDKHEGQQVYMLNERRIIENRNYINKQSSSYKRRWLDV